MNSRGIVNRIKFNYFEYSAVTFDTSLSIKTRIDGFSLKLKKKWVPNKYEFHIITSTDQISENFH
jgi:hypothetical protein